MSLERDTFDFYFKKVEKIMPPKDQVRENIINAAKELFAHYGFKKTTMDEIAQHARKGKSSLYYYFKSKEEVFEAVVEEEVSILRRRVNENVKEDDPAEEQLKNYVITRMDSLQELFNICTIITQEKSTDYHFVEKLREKYLNREIERIEVIIEKGVSTGRFKEIDPHLATLAFVTAMKGLEIPLLKQKTPKDLIQRTTNLLDIILYGMVKK